MSQLRTSCACQGFPTGAAAMSQSAENGFGHETTEEADEDDTGRRRVKEHQVEAAAERREPLRRHE